ncbi:hypothetical protein FRC02_007239 [Tulasnella sp. 418]|nr:hypothetical protein FRC02_007239 [Tulasnella sp. 418]
MSTSLEEHIKQLKNRLSGGRDLLRDIRETGSIETLPIKGVEPDKRQLTLVPPSPDDPFFLATDEKDPESRRWLQSQGAVLIDDLLTKQDRREFGWPILVTDVKGVLEQAVLRQSYHFNGHALSSGAGGAVNLRAGSLWKGSRYQDFASRLGMSICRTCHMQRH